MEKLARLQYLKKKDAKDCALLYIALNRLQVLAGLFKISKDEKDKALVGFLSRNFQVFPKAISNNYSFICCNMSYIVRKYFHSRIFCRRS